MKRCPNCGTSLSDDQLFCTECGASLAAAPPPPPPDSPTIQIPPVQPPPPGLAGDPRPASAPVKKSGALTAAVAILAVCTVLAAACAGFAGYKALQFKRNYEEEQARLQAEEEARAQSARERALLLQMGGAALAALALCVLAGILISKTRRRR